MIGWVLVAWGVDGKICSPMRGPKKALPVALVNGSRQSPLGFRASTSTVEREIKEPLDARRTGLPL